MKTAIDSIVVEGKTYVPAETVQEAKGDVKICILQRGWVMIGRFERNGNDCKLHNSFNIRRWGTTKGLGELASCGKLKDTVLDKNYGVVEFDYLTVVAMISCVEDKWLEI
jgi:hypothetical protein